MLILTEENTVAHTDQINYEVHYSVLSFEDYKNPDFYFRKIPYLDAYNCAAISLEIGPFKTIIPLHFWVLCTDYEYVQTIPLYELNPKEDPLVFCFNPISGFRPEYYRLRVSTNLMPIFPSTNWTMPPVAEKDMIVVPLGEHTTSDKHVGPICAIFSPNKLEVSRSLSDIW